MLYADEVGTQSTSAEGLEKMMTVIMTVCEAASLTVSEITTEKMLLRTPSREIRTSPLVVEETQERYMPTMQFLYLGGLIDASADIMPEVKRQIRLARACYTWFKGELYDIEDAPFTLNVRMLKSRGDGDSCLA